MKTKPNQKHQQLLLQHYSFPIKKTQILKRYTCQKWKKSETGSTLAQFSPPDRLMNKDRTSGTAYTIMRTELESDKDKKSKKSQRPRKKEQEA